MSALLPNFPSGGCHSQLARLLEEAPSGVRASLMYCIVSCRPSATFGECYTEGKYRAAFAELWERQFGCPVPIAQLTAVLEPPVPIGTVLQFNNLAIPKDPDEIEIYLRELILHLWKIVRKLDTPKQSLLFYANAQEVKPNPRPASGRTVQTLNELLDEGRKFRTIYADPPWAYENNASRGAAVNHYPTMSVDTICREPVRDLVEENAHLHLWVPNSFLRESFDVINAWGFEFKSSLVWTKGHHIGCGNYWRLLHEHLLLGVRGNLAFRDHTLPSWVDAKRTIHSRKPGIVRTLIERASPAPYLELYGREELPNSQWTVYGNQVESRLF